MTRRLMLAALAMFTILSLASCGVSRVAGPTSFKPKPVAEQPANGGGGQQGDDEQPVAGRH